MRYLQQPPTPAPAPLGPLGPPTSSPQTNGAHGHGHGHSHGHAFPPSHISPPEKHAFMRSTPVTQIRILTPGSPHIMANQYNVAAQPNRHHNGTPFVGGNPSPIQRQPLIQASTASIQHQPLHHENYLIDHSAAANMSRHNAVYQPQQNMTNVNMQFVNPASGRRTQHTPVFVPRPMQYYVLPNPQTYQIPSNMYFLNPPFQPAEAMPQYSTPPAHSEPSYVPPSQEYTPQSVFQPTESTPHTTEPPQKNTRPRNLIKIQNPETLEEIKLEDDKTPANNQSGSGTSGGDASKDKTMEVRQELYDKVHNIVHKESSTGETLKSDSVPKTSPVAAPVSNGPLIVEAVVIDPAHVDGMNNTALNMAYSKVMAAERPNSNPTQLLYDPIKQIDARSELITPVVSANTNAPAKHITHKRGNDSSSSAKTGSVSNVAGSISGSSPARQINKKTSPGAIVMEPKKIVQNQSIPMAVNSNPSAVPAVEPARAVSGSAPVAATTVPAEPVAASIAPVINTAQQPSSGQDGWTVAYGKKKNQVPPAAPQVAPREIIVSQADDVIPVPIAKEKREKNKANSQTSSVAKDGHKTNESNKSQNVPSTNQKSSSSHPQQKSAENASPARQNQKKSIASSQNTESKKNAANASQHAPVTTNSFSSVVAAQDPVPAKISTEVAPAEKPQEDFKTVVSKKSKKEQAVVHVEPTPEPEVPAPPPKEKRDKNKANQTAAKEVHANAKNEKSPPVPSSNQKTSQQSHKEKSDKEKSDKVDKAEKAEKVDKVEKFEKEKEKVDKAEKEKPEKVVEKPEKEKLAKVEKAEKPEKAAKVEKIVEKVEKIVEKVEKVEPAPEPIPEVLPSAPVLPEPTPVSTIAESAPVTAPAPSAPPAPIPVLNPDAQWTPTNPVGKRKYSKEFIYSLAELPQCRIPPSLPGGLRALVEKSMSGGGGSGGGPSMYRSKIEDLYPFSKGSSSSPRISHNSAFSSFPSITKRSSQNRGMKPNKIQLSLSLHEDVKLKETENAWKPKPLAKNVADKPSEERETEELYNKVRSILNKLTPQKLNTLVNQITDLPINNPDRLAGVVNLIINKAIDEPNFSEAYAKMCKILSTSKCINFEKTDADKNQTDFRRVLLNCCQKQFELREKIEKEYKEKVAKEQKECTEPEKLKELKLQHAEEERKIRMKAAGHCRFIGELFKLDMLKTSIMHYCITYLLKRTEEEPLESLCKLLTTIGKHYENRIENRGQALDPIMDELSRLASKNKKKKNAPQISSRIRFMIQDVLDLRMNHWVPRRDDNTPKTIDQIQQEANREQLEINVALANTSMKKLDRPRMDDRKKSGHFSMGSDDWQTPKNSFKTPSTFKAASYSIDTSKFENFKNMSMEPVETMRLGMAKPNIWASGATTNKAQPEPPRNKFAAGNQFALLESHESNQFSLNNSASNKSSTLDRDKSRDNRNISQDDEMLQKRGPAMGAPSREGSVMRSAPPSIQPPAPVVLKPVLSDEDIKKVVRSTLDEFINIKDFKDVEYTLSKKFVTPACLGKFVDAFIEYFLEKRKDQEVIAPVLANLLDSKFSHFTPQLLVERFDDFLSMAEDLIIDYPKLWDYMAMIIGYTLTSEHFNFDHVRQSCKSILRTDNSKTVLAYVFNVINSIKTPVWISNKWNSSNVNLKDFIADNDIDEFIKTNKLEYLSDPNAPVLKSSTPTLTFDEIKTKLLQILRDHPDDALVPVQTWVNENWMPGQYNHTLIRPLMTAICEASITGPGEKNQFNKEAFEKHFKLIRYFVDLNPNLEAHCLMAVSMLMEKLQHPKGLALNFFQNLMEHVMSLEGFKRFHTGGNEIDPPENSEENRIRGIVVLGTRSFWVSVEETLDNSDDEGTS